MSVRVVLCVALWAMGAPAWSRADDSTVALERSVKAAFLYKFGVYVEWQPMSFATPDAPFTIGIVGDNALARELAEVVAGRTIGSRKIAVVAVNVTDPVEGIQMLFVGRSAHPYMPQIMRSIQMRPVLVITETEGALGDGSMINFILRNARVRFEISLQQAARHGLVLSSRLLGVAQSVVTGTP